MKYYEIIKPEKPEDDRKEGAITIFHLNQGMDRTEALLAISIAVLEVKDWFNVKGNLTDLQVKMIAEMILDHPQFYDMSLANIKACFRHKMMTEKLYDRLDGNIILGWLRQFKSDMADACYQQKVQKDREEIAHEERDSENGLEKRALDLLKNLPSTKRLRTREEQEEWRKEFLKYKAQRLMDKRNEK